MDGLKALINIMIGVFACIIIFHIFGWTNIPKDTIVVKYKETVVYEPVQESLNGWDIMIMAIAWHESRFKTDAVNKQGSSARGILQQLDKYVEECNRIIGEDIYELSDRFNPSKALEMFEIIQDYHNPKKDWKSAVKIHGTGNKFNLEEANWLFKEIEEIESWIIRYEEFREVLINHKNNYAEPELQRVCRYNIRYGQVFLDQEKDISEAYNLLSI